ncbi:SPOR domain-containing protein [Vibrio hannami]|uniref:SPOR domain-containing protein n=1 Tax=Vibrio hannami TaxID=2717094 RepID=UPI00240EF196|nr:SPOR domain-containing protein [Vibrio hannami]MDG3086798.1 SPOR domain-containing protein [Vibrio hannami]
MKNFLTGKSLLAVSLLISGQLFFSGSALADEEYVCEARQNSNNELPVLSEACPIGKGLWGRKPSANDDLFWIQCGVFPEPLALGDVQEIYEKISVDVWLKPEAKGHRCLIGPYDQFGVAQYEAKLIREITAYKDSFVRAVNTKAKSEPKKASKPKPVVTPKPKPTPKPQVVAPKAEPKKPEVVTQKTQPAKKTSQAVGDDSIVIRREVKVGSKKFVIPFLMEGNEQFYMEHGIAWNRLSYDKSNMICSNIGMTLVDETSWQQLIDSKKMSQKSLPLHLPYWGKGKRGLFTSGKVTQLTGTSLLNVICMD